MTFEDAIDRVRTTLDAAGVDPANLIACAIAQGALDAEILEALGIEGLDEEVSQFLYDTVSSADG